MKITKIKNNQSNIYIVYFEPTWFEKIFKIQPYQKKYKDTGNFYVYGKGSVYIDQKGRKLGNGNWIGKRIDEWRRKF